VFEDDTASKSSKARKITEVDSDIKAVLSQNLLNGGIYEDYRFVTIRGQRFSPKHVSLPQSLCFFPSKEGLLVPGRVRQILAVNGVMHLVIHQFTKQESSFFDKLPDFGAEVWSIKTESVPLIIPVPAVGARIYPMNYLQWSTTSAVMRPLIDVSAAIVHAVNHIAEKLIPGFLKVNS
jgi:hypothetical protein